MTQTLYQDILNLLGTIYDEDWRYLHCRAYDACITSDVEHEAFFDWLCHDFSSIEEMVSLYMTDNDVLKYRSFAKNYILNLYLVLEKIFQILQMIWLKDTQVEALQWFYHKNFQAFKLIHKWANFYKHPQFFSYAHDPQFWIEWYEPEPTFTCANKVIVDSEYVLENYGSNYKSKKSKVKWDLQNHDCVWVKIPNLKEVTEKFIHEYNFFINLICDNSVFAELMQDTTVLDNYYDQEVHIE